MAYICYEFRNAYISNVKFIHIIPWTLLHPVKCVTPTFKRHGTNEKR